MIMRKRIVDPVPKDSPLPLPDGDWLDLEHVAQVEVTSEDAAYPVESALAPGAASGWRAAQPGQQTIRLIFDRPQGLRRIWLLFIEPDVARTQEFVLSGSPAVGDRSRTSFASSGISALPAQFERSKTTTSNSPG